MDTNSVTNSSVLMKSGQTQQALLTVIMKQAAAQQNQIANMLAQQASQPVVENGNSFTFSTYA